MLESLGSEGAYVGESQFSTTLKDYLNYTPDTDMTSKYADYKNYSALEKLQAKQFDYEKRLVSDMIDRGITSEKGIDLLPTDELKTKYSFIDDATDANVIKELQLAEYRNSKYGTDVADSVTLYFDDNGKVVSAGNQTYKTSLEDSVKYTTVIEDYLNTSKNFLLDETMESIYPGYKDLTPLEKIQAKQFDFDYRQVNLELDKIMIQKIA